MRIDPGELDKRIEIWRTESRDDGIATVPGEPVELARRWAKKTDISDGEKLRAGENAASLASRFLVRSDSVTRTLNPGTDTICWKGKAFQITGVKDSGDREDGIEITTSTRTDGAA
jgi:head-tail adaptor